MNNRHSITECCQYMKRPPSKKTLYTYVWIKQLYKIHQYKEGLLYQLNSYAYQGFSIRSKCNQLLFHQMSHIKQKICIYNEYHTINAEKGYFWQLRCRVCHSNWVSNPLLSSRSIWNRAEHNQSIWNLTQSIGIPIPSNQKIHNDGKKACEDTSH